MSIVDTVEDRSVRQRCRRLESCPTHCWATTRQNNRNSDAVTECILDTPVLVHILLQHHAPTKSLVAGYTQVLVPEYAQKEFKAGLFSTTTGPTESFRKHAASTPHSTILADCAEATTRVA